MKVIVLGAAGFIGSNLAIELSKKANVELTLVDTSLKYFSALRQILPCAHFVQSPLNSRADFDKVLHNQDLVFHLLSSTVPTTSNKHISEELRSNVVITSELLESCVENRIHRIIFMSSGGTVYGKVHKCPINEEAPTNPINSYGVQKITIEKLLYLYSYLYGIDYEIIRLANPYGPYQRPNGVLGVVTTFVYQALKGETISIYGDGNIVRDFIYIGDAVRGILNIAFDDTKAQIYNLGSGQGLSVNDVVHTIENTLNTEIKIKYLPGRKADVPINYLDISKYTEHFGIFKNKSLSEGVLETAKFMRKEDMI